MDQAFFILVQNIICIYLILRLNRINRMLDIRGYRRKQRHVEPLTVMRQFYYDYKGSIPIKNKFQGLENIDPLGRQTLSIQKFQKYVDKLENNQNNLLKYNQIDASRQNQIGTIGTDSSNRYNKINSTCDGRVNNKVGKIRIGQKDDHKQGSFQSMFSSTVAFLKCHPSIAHLKQQQLNPISANISVEATGERSVQRGIEWGGAKVKYWMERERKEGEERRKRKKEKVGKIRQDWILNNLYKDDEAKEDCKSKSIKTFRFRSKLKIREDFTATKQNIFPS